MKFLDLTLLFQQLWNGLINGMVYVQFSLGLTLLFGVLRVVNISHGEFFMIGGMLVATLQEIYHLNFFVALIPAVIAVGVIGFVCNRLAVRPLINSPETSTLLSTMAISYILLNGSRVLWPYPKSVNFPYPNILNFGGVSITAASLISLALGAVIVVLLYVFLTELRLGKEVWATAQNRTGASLYGINVKRIYDVTFIIAAALAAAGGILVAPIWQTNTSIGISMIIKGFAIITVAGMGNVVGCMAVGLGAGILEAVLGNYVSTYYKEGLLYIVMIIVLLMKPGGLFGRSKEIN